MTRLYISGPVTGRPDNGWGAFADARNALCNAGFQVLDPHDLVPSSLSHEDAMLLCVNTLTDHMWSDNRPKSWFYGLALLPGWEQSDGAKLEKAVADACGIPCKTVDEWLEEAASS